MIELASTVQMMVVINMVPKVSPMHPMIVSYSQGQPLVDEADWSGFAAALAARGKELRVTIIR